MKPLLYLVSGISAVWAATIGFDIGQMTTKASYESFDYLKADDSERETFLNSLAAPMERDLKRALINPSGVGLKLFFKGRRVNTDARSIHFKIMIAGGRVQTSAWAKFRRDSTRKFCSEYDGTIMSNQNVAVVQQFIDGDHKSLGRIVVSNSVCSKIS